ncbi:NitT/TauT family transport system ATP-binding protein [Evansella caseinilytica]|uniref:NitT/TauT family transport system ATP-binding protein n=1 Tax=Evansella caseinilytica TaxID=1503961 RepID=A0A1H3RZT4_9BACI|nr:ABC transporter ATP-binding protein [Evansella caseinilytica]SDZ30888.1 NitT/TauT family transport system ATP-binding protein [Evansella caseinilytica]
MQINGITFSHGKKPIFNDFSIYLPEKEITCILGNSGVGKTTLLKLIARIYQVENGTIEGNQKRVSYLFQEPRLLPWKTVFENVEYVLLNKLSKAEREERITDILEQVGLTAEKHSFPHELSGGMKQRAAIARAFVGKPDILLLDEPLQGLDVVKKMEIHELLLTLWDRYQPTVVYVTHDVAEAIAVGQQILVFHGRPVAVQCQCFVHTPLPKRNAEDEQAYLKGISEHLLLQMKLANEI